MESVTIPASVKGIGSEAFRICRDLTSVMMCGVLPKTEADVFEVVPDSGI
ncbi:MAG: leucine-rich repeat domain-containing protein [Clostridia bacterium]|nr:leucine-rich repeat domain-containing protein [Clostridia bacterium]